ncbi:MAG TPA: tetratricopeptide repeat protein, partial [Kofleriaceae bacterium]
MFRAAVIALLLVGSSAIAFADEETAKKDFSAGERAYNLGDFTKAVELFKKAYEEWPEPAFLFNIAQTYRQSGDCKQALFFYKRFLALKQNDTKKPIKPDLKKEVENRIGELEECTRREIANKPPDQLDNGQSTATSTTTTTKTNPNPTNPTNPTGTTTTANTSNEEDNEEEDTGEQPTPGPVSTQPKVLALRVSGGAGKLTAGDLDTPIQFSGTIVGGYPLPLAPKFRLELGAALSFMPVPYTATTGEHGSGGLFGIVANVAPTYEL